MAEDPGHHVCGRTFIAQLAGEHTGRGRSVKFEQVFPIEEVYRGDPEERNSHMNVPPGWAALDCTAATSFDGAEPAAMLAQACEKRGGRAGDDRKAEAVKEKYHFRGDGEQEIASFIKLQGPGTLGGQDVQYAPSINDSGMSQLVGNGHFLPWGSSIHLYPGDCWLEIPSVLAWLTLEMIFTSKVRCWLRNDPVTTTHPVVRVTERLEHQHHLRVMQMAHEAYSSFGNHDIHHQPHFTNSRAALQMLIRETSKKRKQGSCVCAKETGNAHNNEAQTG